MARIEDLVAYAATAAAISAACGLALQATPLHAVPDAPQAPVARRALIKVAAQMPEEYRRDFARGIAACFDPANPPSQQVIDEINSMYFFGQRYDLGGRWSQTASGSAGVQGDPMTLLWSFVPDTVSIPGGAVQGEVTSNSQLFARMDALFGNANRAVWVQQFVRCFARWESLSGITYGRVQFNNNDWDDGAAWSSSGAIGLRGDVRIGMHPIDGQNGVLAYDSFPGGGVGGNMVMDSGEIWSASSLQYRFLRNTVMHEHGHGLGFAHVCPVNNTRLMEPFLSTSFDGPQQDEVRGVQRQYGDPYEPNNNAGQAVDMGALATPGAIILGNTPTTIPGDTITWPILANTSILSIDANGEQDWWKFSTAASALVTVTITPVGSSYVDNSQNGGGNDGCSGATGGTTNSLAIADLAVRITTPNGLTSFANINATTAGSPEVVTSFLVSGGSTYAVAVYEVDSPTESQGYRLNFTATAPTSLGASDAASSTSIALNWTNIPGATVYQVFRGATPDFAAAAQVGTSTVNSYSDTAVSPGQTFFYWVKATQIFGGFSNVQFVGGPEQGSTSAPANSPPTANAGPDQSVRDPQGDGAQAVTLNGSASSDSDGSIVSYVWTEGALTVATGATPTVSFGGGSHTLTLTVTDDDGATGTDTVVVAVAENQAPVANAGPDQTVTDSDNSGSEIVDLTGAGSTDADGSIASYRWTEGDVEVGTGINPTIFLAVGSHSIVLTVTDNEGRTAVDAVVIQVEAGTPPCPADFNQDGFLDFFDYDDFVNCYETGNCPPGTSADYNGDGFADFFDYDDFVAGYEAGC